MLGICALLCVRVLLSYESVVFFGVVVFSISCKAYFVPRSLSEIITLEMLWINTESFKNNYLQHFKISKMFLVNDF